MGMTNTIPVRKPKARGMTAVWRGPHGAGCRKHLKICSDAVDFVAMDGIDRQIIAELVEDGRLSVTELSDRVSLSLSATSQRLRRLVDGGAITRFTVALDSAVVGRPIDALVDVRLPSGGPFADLDAEVLSLPEVVDAVHLTGRFDYQLRLRCASIDDLDTILRNFKETLGVEETSTRIVLSTVTGMPRQPTPA